MIGVVAVLIVIVLVFLLLRESEKTKTAHMTPSEKQKYIEESLASLTHGPINSALICPHCQEKGKVRTKRVNRKKGISGGKATAAILTAGVSTLATGLSRKEECTEAFCDNCSSQWDF